jgi:NADH-quinone oxidoreductase subunit J
METTPELVLFFLMALLSIAAAVGMLVSQNAVHSALLLVANFACVAFLFLIMHAPFLAMVQIAVYAGAIMVLFMFVIMLLGTERLTPEQNPRFPWFGPLTIGLGALFLLLVGVAILESEISAQPGPQPEPLVRAINIIPDYEHISIRLNGQGVAEDLTYRAESDLMTLAPGQYQVEVLAHVEGAEEAISLSPLSLLTYVVPEIHSEEVAAEETTGEEAVSEEAATEEAAEEEAAPVEAPAPVMQLSEALLTLDYGQDLTLVLTVLADGSYGIIPVYENLQPVENAKLARIQVVHAVAGAGLVDVAEISQADRRPVRLFEGLAFGQVSEIQEKRKGDYRYGVYADGEIEAVSTETQGEYKVADVEAIATFEQKDFTGNTSTLYLIAPPLNRELAGQNPELLHYITDNRPQFGSPEAIGYSLFTTYMLPFQIVALLLLVAMVGAIVLTRDQVAPPRKRFERRLANTGSVLGPEK